MERETNQLTYIKDAIEKMSKTHQIEVLRILKTHSNIKLNENKSGIFVNLSFLSDDALGDISKYVNYIREQEHTLETIEIQKTSFKNSYFSE